MKKTSINLFYFFIIFAFVFVYAGCSKKEQRRDTSGDNTVQQPPNYSARTDSTNIYGQGYFDYRDNIESYHMGYSKPRDSAYKVENLKAFEKLNLLIAADSTKPGPYLDRANHLQNIQKYREAIADYNKYIQMNPYNHSAYQNRGTAHERLKEYDKALSDYSKVIELKPNDTIAYFNRGVVYDAINNPWQAIREYTTVIQIDPRLAKAYYNRGAAYERIEDYENAIKDYETAMRLNPPYRTELEKKIDYLNYTFR